MHLSALLPHLSFTQAQDKSIKRLTLDARNIQPNDVFIAVPGSHVDGRSFIPDAISRGAAAVIFESDQEDASFTVENNIPLIPVYKLREHLGLLAAHFYDHPTSYFPVVGVTGTNGKTSCTHFFADLWQQIQKQPCGLIGTLGAGCYGALKDTGLTTPDAISVQAFMKQFLDAGVTACAMEVSSHSIHQGRILGCAFEVGIFTNLTQDHLDYHGDMSTYAEVKRSFLAAPFTNQLVLNIDDEHGKKWAKELSDKKSIYVYGCHPVKTSLPGSFATAIKPTSHGTEVMLDTSWGKASVHLPLVGEFNVSNVLAVVTTLCVLGVPFERIITALPLLHPVPGRMQRMKQAGGPLVVVDYAHTPDALYKALAALKKQTHGKLVCVFGCGGDRDQQKRPLMAEAVEAFADRIIVTNDNPRHENPKDIAADIMKGFKNNTRVEVELDRSQAILNSIQSSGEADCILIAGKGAETYQQIGDERIPFSDVTVVQRLLSEQIK